MEITDHLVLSLFGHPGDAFLAKGLQRMGFYNFNPGKIRALQAPSTSTLLEKDGSNLASTLEALDCTTKQRVRDYLSIIADEVEGFQTISYGKYKTIRFNTRSGKAKSHLEFDAASMSDGTLRALAALAAAFQMQQPEGPTLVAIEELETSLHPGAMRALVDALDEATMRTQILLTTHSAEMLDNPTIQPSNIRVVQLIDGQTVIGPVDEASIEIVRRKLNTLGGLERENQLEPDLDDQRRQREMAQARKSPP